MLSIAHHVPQTSFQKQHNDHICSCSWHISDSLHRVLFYCTCGSLRNRSSSDRFLLASASNVTKNNPAIVGPRTTSTYRSTKQLQNETIMYGSEEQPASSRDHLSSSCWRGRIEATATIERNGAAGSPPGNQQPPPEQEVLSHRDPIYMWSSCGCWCW
jgi:hypothetical protein